MRRVCEDYAKTARYSPSTASELDRTSQPFPLSRSRASSSRLVKWERVALSPGERTSAGSSLDG